ncbi:secreted RxLR effector protein 161-like [Mangifera indica]|uniref:secreted RxLR effector protein 161-like n=1 Tax=Mangifera indica TaxID=29780 RepID=UPI001CF99591|nr:secreted RxLR effector protein 161-like [Mangifera indica]
MCEVPYASAVGSLMYAMLCTRPDIAFAVSAVSKYQSNPGERHWTTVKAILKYLRRTKELILGYGGSELTLKGYSDSDFQSDVDDRKSTSAFIFVCNGGAVSWKSAKQSTTADSTTEAEYIAASEAAKEAVWMRKFATELGVVPQMSQPVILFCDNTGAIAQAKEPRAHQKSKHVQRKYHILREFVGAGDIVIQKIASADNLADPLTKALTQRLLDQHLEKMGIRYYSDWL